MKYVDEFRNPRAARTLNRRISTNAHDIGASISIMEVCGTHTMSIARNGIRSTLPDNINLISGPGCPVCVTQPGYIDAAMELARDGVLIATFGDMLKTPGSETTLAECRADGGRIEVCYSPQSAIDLAIEEPEREVVFLAIGFETTIAPVVSLVAAAEREGIANLSLLTAFKVVPPVLEILCQDSELAIDAFLCPAHVSAIIGSDAYSPLVEKHGIPCVVAGFEPLDILLGIDGILEQISSNQPRVDNQYSRIVSPGGNRKAQAIMSQYLEADDAVWRGLGRLPASGLRLRPQYSRYDAEKRFELRIQPGREAPGCICGDVVKGKSKPGDCPLFGAPCTPEHPIGPCMVSQEGSCAAHYKYR